MIRKNPKRANSFEKGTKKSALVKTRTLNLSEMIENYSAFGASSVAGASVSATGASSAFVALRLRRVFLAAF